VVSPSARSAVPERSPEADLAGLPTLFLTDAIYRLPASGLAAAQTAAGDRAHAFLFAAEPPADEAAAAWAAASGAVKPWV
jgi:para-nitrobenzyl esterase